MACASALPLLIMCAPAVAADELRDLGVLPGGSDSAANGVNAAGDVVVGWSSSFNGLQAFRWTATAGLGDLGVLPGGHSSYANGVNAAGDVVVGWHNSPGGLQAFRWTATGGLADLGVLPGGIYSSASAVNAAGDVVVGVGDSSSGTQAFRWTGTSTMTGLGVLPGGAVSFANAVNAAGDVVVGGSDSSNGYRAFRWTAAANHMADLGVLSGGAYSSANGVNAAGDVVIGESDSSNGTRAFRWTAAANNMTDLGVLRGGSYSSANGVNAAGDVVVGQGDLPNGLLRAFRWTASTGMQSVEQWLASHGVATGNIATLTAKAVNADGNVVVGSLENSHAFIARVTPGGSGLIDVEDFSTTLQAAARTQSVALGKADLVLNGLHGAPSLNLLDYRKTAFWVIGDWGVLRHSDGGGQVSAGEVGGKVGLAQNWQAEVGLGQEQSRGDTPYQGTTSLRRTYIAPGLSWRAAGSDVVVNLLAYYGSGRADLDRGYLNAGLPVISRGSPGITTLAARLRVDWIDALTAGPVAVTPYAGLTWIRNKLSGYTETGGGFPVQWDAQDETARVARAGLDATWRARDNFSVLARLEYAHRLHASRNRTTGRIVGLGAFSLEGDPYQQAWRRLGLGGQYRLDSSASISATLNVTTQLDVPRIWINLVYNKAF